LNLKPFFCKKPEKGVIIGKLNMN